METCLAVFVSVHEPNDKVGMVNLQSGSCEMGQCNSAGGRNRKHKEYTTMK